MVLATHADVAAQPATLSMEHWPTLPAMRMPETSNLWETTAAAEAGWKETIEALDEDAGKVARPVTWWAVNEAAALKRNAQAAAAAKAHKRVQDRQRQKRQARSLEQPTQTARQRTAQSGKPAIQHVGDCFSFNTTAAAAAAAATTTMLEPADADVEVQLQARIASLKAAHRDEKVRDVP